MAAAALSWQYVLAWVLIAVNAALVVVNMRTQRRSKATLERLASLLPREDDDGEPVPRHG